MLQAALLFVPLLSGFLFAESWRYTRYKAAREDSQRLYFRAAFFGIVLAVVATIISLALRFTHPQWLGLLGETLHLLLPWRLLNPEADWNAELALGWGMAGCFLGLTLLLGALLGHLLNSGTSLLVRCRVLPASRAPLQWAITQSGDDFETLLFRALGKTMPVLATMANRKVYVGQVVELAEPQGGRRTLRLLPLLSGYRREPDGKVIFTTNYSQIYERIIQGQPEAGGELDHLDIDDFEIVLPCAQLQSLSLFDIAAYNRFQLDGEGLSVVRTPEQSAPDLPEQPT